MKIIKQMAEYIEEELGDSEKYVLKALECKEKYPELANAFYTLSLEEMKHMQLLHEWVVKIIEDYKKKEGDPPVSMQAVYDFLHKRFINKKKEIRIMQDMYAEK